MRCDGARRLLVSTSDSRPPSPFLSGEYYCFRLDPAESAPTLYIRNIAILLAGQRDVHDDVVDEKSGAGGHVAYGAGAADGRRYACPTDAGGLLQ